MIISYVQPPTATIEPPMAAAHEGEGSRVVKTISSDNTPTTLAAVIKEALESSIRHMRRSRASLEKQYPDLGK